MDSAAAHDSPSSHSLRQHFHFSSPSANKIAPSASTSSATPSSHTLNGEDAIVSIPITVDDALNAHADSPDPMRAALEAILAERNSLSAQNSQLWNHLKRQRANYASAVKDVVRLRSERDVLRGKLNGLDNVEGPSPVNGRKLRTTVSSVAMSSTNGTGSGKETQDHGRTGPSKSSSNPRASMTRHQSDDTPASSRRPASPYGEIRSQTPTILQTRSQEPVRGQDRARSNTHPGVTSVDSEIAVAGPSTPVSSNFQQPAIRQHAKSASLDVSPIPQLLLPTPLIIPPRDETSTSASTPASGASSAVSIIRPLNFSPRRDRNSPESSRQASSGLLHPTTNASSTSSSPINLSPDDIQVAESRSLSSTTHNTPSVNLTPNYHVSLAVAAIRQASRESRISLPDEAKRFIANMGESPLSSPHTNGHPDNWSAKPKEHQSSIPRQSSDDDNRRDVEGRPFLDLEDDSDIDPRVSEETKVQTIRGSDSELDVEGTEETAVDFDYTPKRGALSGNQQTPKRTTSTTADQFPLPPATFVTPPRAPTSPTTADLATMQTNLNASSSSRTTSLQPTLEEPTGRRSRDKNRDSFMIPENAPEAKFRQMPLLNTDVKAASVRVVGSHIRANDRGKEVLSFVVQVDVTGKDGWTIEKFYSDVLALDSRLRSLCSRGTLKKLSPLPDNKLFKDHAPAKVDQRKQVLQTYLQSVMALPIKDKNEIIVFFSTDIMRERSPVTKNGYKEGYLTKRGKNFGGWKTRYFVLQGPVLEYYESRGGTHLGSIPIVGAQIGRQQRTGDKRDSDDENDFRHAFLILERKRGPGGQVVQHVLCCESDAERDAWVDVLMRYVMGTYNDEENFTNGPTMDPQGSVAQQHVLGQPRTSTSSLSVNEISSTPGRRSALSKDLIQKSNVQPIPISQLSQDKVHAKFFQAAPIPDNTSSSPGKSTSPIDRPPGATLPLNEFAPKSSLERFQSANSANDDTQLSSSVPTSSNLDAAVGLAAIGQRAASELGYYADMPTHRGSQSSPEQSRARERTRASFHPTLTTVQPSPTERPTSPDMNLLSTSTRGDSRQVKISAPVKATPILDSQAFRGRASSELTRPSTDRERKAKSRTFWGFGRTSDKQSGAPVLQPRAVFGVSLEESLAVSQEANLPSIIYRCIQYLEAKHAEQEEGVYRLSGSSAVIKSLKDRFNAEGDVDLLGADEDWDPHAIAGLLKSFLRELPSSVLTHDLHSRFLGVIDLLDLQDRIKELQELISQLPFTNYCLLRALTAHLILIVQNSNVNKMTMRNVGIVFSPTLGIPAGVFSLMMSEFNRVFNVEGDGTDSPEEEAEAPPSKRSSGLSRRNSKRYSDAAVDQVLGLSGRSLPVTEEDRSDEGDDVEETESDVDDTTEAETEGQTVESSAESTRATSPVVFPVYQEQVHPPPTNSIEVPQTPKSRASNVAASRGLNINVVQVDVDVRRARIPGLPASPRPSPLNTPTSGPHAGSSPSHTPR